MSKLKDVADLANVSTATVSRVINGADSVKEPTKQKVLDAMAALHYQPNLAARRLAGGKSHVIGLMTSEFLGPVFSTFLDEIERNLKLNGKYMVVNTGHADVHNEIESLNFLMNAGVDGLILYSEAVDEATLVEVTQKIPTVILNRTVDVIAESCINQDNILGMQLIMEHLHESGFTEASYIFGDLNKPDGVLRKKGALIHAERLGIKTLYTAYSDFTTNSGYFAMKQMLAQEKRPKLVVCANDETALGALRAMNEQGLRCPDDIALTGYDNIVNLDAASTPITTVQLPVRRMSREAVKLIMNKTYNQHNPIQNMFKPELIIRDSSIKK